MQRRHQQSSDPLEAAFKQLLAESSVGLPNAPSARAIATFWRTKLLYGEGKNPAPRIKRIPLSTQDPIAIVDVAIHLVCPHHLTVALGVAHLAFLPSRFTTSLGSLSRLIQICTARRLLQEDATRLIIDSLVERLGPRAAIALIDARHPCHHLRHPRSMLSLIRTRADHGEPTHLKRLESLLPPWQPNRH